MKIGLVGPTYQQRSLPFDAQRTINLYPVLDNEGRDVAALYGTPGLSLFATAGSGAVRGIFESTNGRVFTVSNNGLYELTSAGVVTLRGTLDTTSGAVTIDENPFQLAVCDGASLYILTYATNVFAKVTDPDLPVAGTLTYIDSYFVVNKVGTGQFYISGVNDGTTWAALDFASAESSPDELRRVINAAGGQLWLLGTRTTEAWTNTGASAFPFERIAGAKLDVGILARHSALALDNALFWLAQDGLGKGIVYRTSGYTPQRISTESIELLIAQATDAENIRAFAYQEDGHTFYVLTGGGLPTTMVYDLSTQQWHERAFLNVDGVQELHLAACGAFAFGKMLVGDRRNGKIYHMSMSYYTDNGDQIARDRIYTHLFNEGELFKAATLEIGFETGVGLTSGNGSDPQCSLRVSRDGGRTWSSWFNQAIGAVGNYLSRVRFRRLGIANQMTFWVRISDPVKVAISGSYLK